MKGKVKWIDYKKGYGFIYGTGSIKQDGKENILPEYFFHISQVKSKHIKDFDMVKFKPCTNKKGLLALDVSVIDNSTEYDPRLYIASRIYDEFDIEIPCLTWMYIWFDDMKELYNYLKADKENDEAELKRISEVYELFKIPKEECISCIASGGYYMWEYDKEQMKKDGYWED